MNCISQSLVGKLSLKVNIHKIDVETRSKDNVFVRVSLAVQVKVAQNQKEFAEYQGNYGKKHIQRGKGKNSKVDLNEPEEHIGEGVELMGSAPEKDDMILYNAYYRLENPVEQILSYMEEYFRFHGMEYTLDEMFAARNDMTHELQQMLNYKMNPFGWIVCNILVLDIDPDPKVKQAMNDIITCEKEKRAQQSRAEAEKLTKILAAEAEAKTRELAGEGIANARKAILHGLQESVENFKQALPDSDPNQILKTVLMTQYLDTIKEASLSGRNTFVMPSSPAQVVAIEEQLRIAIGVPENQRVVL
jgi:regulator of protease activity HflC (stomatin/prohibitin superfamily)